MFPNVHFDKHVFGNEYIFILSFIRQKFNYFHFHVVCAFQCVTKFSKTQFPYLRNRDNDISKYCLMIKGDLNC